jgi:class 3 adenylate cyclase
VNEPPPPISSITDNITPALIELIEQMLEKVPSRRPTSAGVVSQTLSNIEREMGVSEQTIVDTFMDIERPASARSWLEETEATIICVEIVGFSRETCQNLLPARVSFLLESWYRLARQSIESNQGVVNRHVADRVTGLFGYPHGQGDHAKRAFQAALSLTNSVSEFNLAHDLQLKIRVGIACGPLLIGRIVGDESSTSIQGSLTGEMVALSKTKSADEPIRLNRAAYRRVASLANFRKFDEPRVSEAWATVGTLE